VAATVRDAVPSAWLPLSMLHGIPNPCSR
jgi:hypothetical protein